MNVGTVLQNKFGWSKEQTSNEEQRTHAKYELINHFKFKNC